MVRKKISGKRLFVLDTNVLMHDPSALFRFDEHDVYLPMVVLEELDNSKKGLSEVSLWFAWILLSISVMTTKQHFFFDIATGVVTALLAWHFMCKPMMDASSQGEWLETLPSESND